MCQDERRARHKTPMDFAKRFEAQLARMFAKTEVASRTALVALVLT